MCAAYNVPKPAYVNQPSIRQTTQEIEAEDRRKRVECRPVEDFIFDDVLHDRVNQFLNEHVMVYEDAKNLACIIKQRLSSKVSDPYEAFLVRDLLNHSSDVYNGANGVTFRLNLGGTSLTCIAKVGIRNTEDDDIAREYKVAIDTLNDVRRLIPNFTYTYAYARLPIVVEQKIPDFCALNNYKPIDKTKGVSFETNTVVLFEDIKNSQSFSDMIMRSTPEEVALVMYQVVCALEVANVTHYDLHVANILMKRIASPVYVHYNNDYVVTQVIPTIIDYGYLSDGANGFSNSPYGIGINISAGFDLYKLTMSVLEARRYDSMFTDPFLPILRLFTKRNVNEELVVMQPKCLSLPKNSIGRKVTFAQYKDQLRATFANYFRRYVFPLEPVTIPEWNENVTMGRTMINETDLGAPNPFSLFAHIHDQATASRRTYEEEMDIYLNELGRKYTERLIEHIHTKYLQTVRQLPQLTTYDILPSYKSNDAKRQRAELVRKYAKVRNIVTNGVFLLENFIIFLNVASRKYNIDTEDGSPFDPVILNAIADTLRTTYTVMRTQVEDTYK